MKDDEVLKLESEIKLDAEEINMLRNMSTEYVHLMKTLGELQYQKQQLIPELEKIQAQEKDVYDKINALKIAEDNIGVELNKKYGNGNVDLNNGIFTPITQ